MTRTYYTLDELCYPYVNPILHNGDSHEFEDVANNIVWHSSVPNWAQQTNTEEYPYLEECWLRVRSLFEIDNHYFFFTDNDYDDIDDVNAECQNRWGAFFNKFYTTKDKYIALIKAQEDLKDSVLSDVSNSTETWFNDTPQMKGDYTDLDYASNYTRTKNNLSLGPVSLKLEEVDKAMEDVYDRWVAEFHKFIIVY